MNFDPAARPSGMGSAFTGLADDANAPLFNPAGLALMGLNLTEATFSAGFLSLNRLNDFLSICQQLPPDDDLGFYVNHYEADNLPGFDADGLSTQTLSDVNLAFGASYAHDFDYHFKAGISASYIYENLAGEIARGFGGIDLGLLFIPTVMEDFTLGASAFHLGGFLDWDGGFFEDLSPDFRLGFSEKLLEKTVVLAYDAEWRTDSAFTILHHMGMEVLPLNFMALRAGLDNGNPTFGAMAEYQNYSLDYSYEFDSNGLGDVQRLGAGFFF